MRVLLDPHSGRSGRGADAGGSSHSKCLAMTRQAGPARTLSGRQLTRTRLCLCCGHSARGCGASGSGRSTGLVRAGPGSRAGLAQTLPRRQLKRALVGHQGARSAMCAGGCHQRTPARTKRQEATVHHPGHHLWMLPLQCSSRAPPAALAASSSSCSSSPGLQKRMSGSRWVEGDVDSPPLSPVLEYLSVPIAV